MIINWSGQQSYFARNVIAWNGVASFGWSILCTTWAMIDGYSVESQVLAHRLGDTWSKQRPSITQQIKRPRI